MNGIFETREYRAITNSKKKKSQNLYLQTGKLDPESTPKLLKISMFRKFEINSLKTLDQ